MEFECPKCGTLNELDSADIPERSCDDTEFECRHCSYETKVGWTAEVEER